MRRLLKAIGISSLIMLTMLLVALIGALIVSFCQYLGMSLGTALFTFFMLFLFVAFTILAYKY